MKPLWVLDNYLLERSTPECGLSLPKALEASGCDISLHSFDPKLRRLEGDLPENLYSRPVLVYGSYSFVRRVLSANEASLQPGSYMRVENLSFHRFSAHIGDLILNDDFYLLPFGELKRRAAPQHDIFIRPDRVTKSFTGFTVKSTAFNHEMSYLQSALNVGLEELVVIASAKPIEMESRYVVAEGRIVAKSTYGWADDFVPSAMTDPRCDEIATEVASRDWQPDTVYTCDVALSGGRARVVELNSFSCSGLYACDTSAVAKAVTAAMIEEFGGFST
jgi:hypothetical protein